jgi:DNA-binding NtrC family response regulator
MAELIHILLVEDDPIASGRIMELVAPLIEAFPGSRITPVRSMGEARLIIDRTPSPDVVLLDLTLPDSMIEETLARIESIEDRSPVVIVTGTSKDRVLRLLKGRRVEIAEKDVIFRERGALVKFVGRAMEAWRGQRFQRLDALIAQAKALEKTIQPYGATET